MRKALLFIGKNALCDGGFFAEGGFRQALLYAEKVYTEYRTNDEPVKEKCTFGFAQFPPFPSFFVYASAKSTRN